MRGSARRAREQGIDVNVQTAGANTSVRLSTLASVGSIGFSDYTDAGSDDIEVGRRISLVRRTNSLYIQAVAIAGAQKISSTSLLMIHLEKVIVNI